MEIALSAKEFDILEYLASRSPDIVSSEDIAEHVYDEFFDPFSSVLRVHIANLRKKLTLQGGQGLLITMKGNGYQLCGQHR
ncbi:winged helix-turn-helix domain-containing protein [Paenibacillus sp. 843]